MAATSVGRMEPFDPANESIVVYLERMQLYFEANGIKAKKQVPVFLNIIGRENYGLLRNLSRPRNHHRNHSSSSGGPGEAFRVQEDYYCSSFSISSVPATAWRDSRHVFG